MTTLSSRRRRPLPHDELAADGRVVGRVVNRRRDIELANRRRHVAAIEQHAIADQLDANLAHQLGKLLAVGQIEPALAGGQRHGPVHRPRIEKTKPQPPRQLASCATLPGTGRSVDGYDHVKVDGSIV